MTRRQWLALAALALPLGCKPPAPQASRGPRKKGLCLSNKRPPQEVAKFVESVGARWLYNWNIEAPETLPAEVEFIPMIYKDRSMTDEALARVQSQTRIHGYGELLGFNEPDARTQGNTSVEKALELWPQLEAMDIVERYCWFHGGVSGAALGSSQLFNPDGSLTVVGKAYRAVG